MRLSILGLAAALATAFAADPPPLPDKLATLVKDLSSPEADQRVAAANALRKLGAEAKPAARALCEVIAAHVGRDGGQGAAGRGLPPALPGGKANPEAPRDNVPDTTLLVACLDALKAVHPKLHPHVEAMALEGPNSSALESLAKMGEDAAPSMPVILTYHQRSLGKRSAEIVTAMAKMKRNPNEHVYSNLGGYASLELAALKALAAAGPLDVETRSAYLAALEYPMDLISGLGLGEGRGQILTLRQEGIRGLVRLAEAHPELRAETVPMLREELAAKADPMRFKTEIIRTLPRLGEASKVALPDLRKLRISSDRAIRDAAAEAIEMIEAFPGDEPKPDDAQPAKPPNGVLVLTTRTPVGRGVEAWVEIDGRRTAQWKVGSTEVRLTLAAGTYRVAVYATFQGVRRTIIDKQVKVAADATVKMGIDRDK